MNRRKVLIALTVVTAAAVPGWYLINRASAFVVFDPSNYAQNVMTAARALTQINNQIQSLQNENVMLQNQAKNLQNLNYSSLTALTSALQQIDVLMGQAQGITYNVNATDASFRQLYPQQYSSAVTSNQLVLDARGRWQSSMDAYRQTMDVQAQVVQNVQADRTLLSDIVTASQGAVGNLQAEQATNQLLALSAKQQLQIQNMMAAQYRAESMDRARAAESQEAGRAASDKFLGSSSAYTPR